MRPLIASLCVLFCACGPLLSGELEASEFCRDFDPIAIGAAPVALAGGLEFEDTVELPAELAAPPQGAQVELELLRVELAAEGVDDLSFIDTAEAAVRSSSGAQLPIGRYEKSEAAPRLISLAPPAGADIASLIAEGPLQLRASISGTLPQTAWTLKVRGCYRTHIAASWTP